MTTDTVNLEPVGLEALARAYDREDAAQMGEPDPWWDIIEQDDTPWFDERIACARAGLEAYLSATASASPAAAEVVAFVPLHPRSGPLWMDTYPAGSDTSERRSPNYARMALYPASAIESLQRDFASLNRECKAEIAWRIEAVARAEASEAHARRVEEALREISRLIRGPGYKGAGDIARTALSASPAAELEASPALAGQVSEAKCMDCGEPYGSPRFHDLVLPNEIWNAMSNGSRPSPRPLL